MVETENVKDIAVSTAQDVREWAADLAEKVRDLATEEPPPVKRGRGRTILLALLVAAGLGAIVWFVRRAQDRAVDVGSPPDAFGEAVLEEQAAARGGSRPVATPGA